MSSRKKTTIKIPPPPRPLDKHTREPSFINKMSTIATEGFAFGVGSSLGSSLVRKIMGPIGHETPANISAVNTPVEITNTNETLFEKYNNCLENKTDISICSRILENQL